MPNPAARAATIGPSPESLRLLKWWRWRVFAATWLCYAGYYFARKPFYIVKADLGRSLDLDATLLGVLGSAYLIAYTVGQFTAGAVGPRLGARLMLLIGMGVSVGAAIGFGFGHSFAWFLVLMILNGLAQATGWSSTVGNMAAWFHRGERGTVMGVWATNFQIGGVLASGLAAWTLARWGFRYAFFSGALVLLGVLVFFFFNQANKPEDKGLPPVVDPADKASANESAAESGQSVRWSKDVWWTVLLIGGTYFGLKFIRYAIWSWAPYVMANNFGLAKDDAGYVSTIFDVAGVAGVIITGWLSDRFFHGRRALVSFLMVLGLVAATLGMVTIGSGSVTAFAVSMALTGFCLYGPDALLTGAGAQDIGNQASAIRAAGIISGLGSAGSVVQELAIGKSYTDSGGDMGPILAMLFGSSLLAAACLAVILVRNRRGNSDL